jgi:hypothetical protein
VKCTAVALGKRERCQWAKRGPLQQFKIERERAAAYTVRPQRGLLGRIEFQRCTGPCTNVLSDRSDVLIVRSLLTPRRWRPHESIRMTLRVYARVYARHVYTRGTLLSLGGSELCRTTIQATRMADTTCGMVSIELPINVFAVCRSAVFAVVFDECCGGRIG